MTLPIDVWCVRPLYNINGNQASLSFYLGENVFQLVSFCWRGRNPSIFFSSHEQNQEARQTWLTTRGLMAHKQCENRRNFPSDKNDQDGRVAFANPSASIITYVWGWDVSHTWQWMWGDLFTEIFPSGWISSLFVVWTVADWSQLEDKTVAFVTAALERFRTQHVSLRQPTKVLYVHEPVDGL